MEKDNVQWNKLVLTSLFALLILVFATGALGVNKEEKLQENTILASNKTYSPFENLQLDARAVYVWSVKDKQMIYGKNINEVLPLASLSKMMTAFVANKYLSGEHITVGVSDLMIEGDSGLFLEERWRADDLIDFMLVVSSNDGAQSLASAYEAITRKDSFVETMNKEAEKLGFSSMTFLNPSGLDSKNLEDSGGYGTVREVVLLFEHILRNKPYLLEATREKSLIFTSESDIEHEAENTNILINDIPFLIGSKTGFTDLAGGNLVLAFNTGFDEEYVIGVLGSTHEGRFTDVKALHGATIEYINLYKQSN